MTNAIHVRAAEMVDLYRGDFVELGSVGDPALMVSAVASVMGLAFAGNKEWKIN